MLWVEVASMMQGETTLRSRFPIMFLTIAVVITVAVFAWLGWNIYDSYLDTKEKTERNLRIEQLRGSIINLGGVLTMSARMAAATGDMSWEERYRSFESQLDATIKEAKKLAPDAYSGGAAAQTDKANIKLVDMEKQSFDFVRQGRLEEARAILSSDEYKVYKRIYARGMARFAGGLMDAVNAFLKSEENKARWYNTTIIVVISILLAGWLIVLQSIRNWRIALVEKNRQLREEITERKHSAEALKESEKRYRDLVDNTLVGLYKSNLKGEFLFVNEALSKMFEFESPEEIRSVRWLELYKNENDREVFLKHLKKTGTVNNYELDLLTKTGKSMNILLSATLDGDVLSGMMMNITERKQAEEALRYRVRFEDLIMNISTHFIGLATHEIDSGINHALQRIGEFSGVDRSYVFLFSDDLAKMDNTHEWCAEGIEPQSDNLKGLSTDKFSWHIEKFRLFETLHIPRIADLPPEAGAEKEEFQSRGIQSLISVPMVYRGRLVGYIGFDSVREEKTWPDEVISLLKIVGENFVNSLQRKKSEEDLQLNYHRLSALRNIDRTISATLDLRVILDVLLDQVTSRLGVDAADILMLNPDTHTLDYVSGRGFRTSALQHTRLRLGKSYAGRVAFERKLIYVQNLPESYQDFRRSPLLPEEDFVTYYGVPLIAKGQAKGVLEIFHRAPIKADKQWLEFLEALAGEAAIAIDNAVLFDKLQRSNTELVFSYDATIEGWSKAIALRDEMTADHSQNVTEKTVRMARIMGMSDNELVHVHRGALLHDIGKMGIPDNILLKPGKLNDEEWEVMRKHPVYAYEMLSHIPFLRPALDIPYCHHEKWDGTGYPRGLKGDEIPLSARIFAVVDVLDALLSDRPYRPAWPKKKAIEYIYEQAGTYFDPKVLELNSSGAFLHSLKFPISPCILFL
jgi:PAS domain S-box-containing protein